MKWVSWCQLITSTLDRVTLRIKARPCWWDSLRHCSFCSEGLAVSLRVCWKTCRPSVTKNNTESVLSFKEVMKQGSLDGRQRGSMGTKQCCPQAVSHQWQLATRCQTWTPTPLTACVWTFGCHSCLSLYFKVVKTWFFLTDFSSVSCVIAKRKH